MSFRARLLISMLLIANPIILRCSGNSRLSTRVQIEIYTRDEIGAGTTCSVVMKLIGTKSSSRFLYIEPKGGEFQRGSREVFYRYVVDYGDLIETRVFHTCDDPYIDESWGLEKIVLTNLDTKLMYQTLYDGNNGNIPNGAMWMRTTKSTPSIQSTSSTTANPTQGAKRLATTIQTEATTSKREISILPATMAKISISTASTTSMEYTNKTSEITTSSVPSSTQPNLPTTTSTQNILSNTNMSPTGINSIYTSLTSNATSSIESNTYQARITSPTIAYRRTQRPSSQSATNMPPTISTTLLPSTTNTSNTDITSLLDLVKRHWNSSDSFSSRNVTTINFHELATSRQLTSNNSLVITVPPIMASKLGPEASQESDESTGSYYWVIPVILIAVLVGILPLFIKRKNRSKDKSLVFFDWKLSTAQKDDKPEITEYPTGNDPEEADSSVSVVGTAGSPSGASSSVMSVVMNDATSQKSAHTTYHSVISV